MPRRRVSLPLFSLLSLVLLPSPAVCQNATATITSNFCGGQSGYYACPASVGGGCCPTGLICGATRCFASTELVFTTITQSDGGKTTTALAHNFTSTTGPVGCGTYDGFFSCAQDVGGGCCPFGYSCDTNHSTRCRLTLKLNEQTEVITTTSGTQTSVYTTTSIVGPSVTAAGRIAITSPPGSGNDGSNTNNNNNNSIASVGLTGPQVGGIVVGVVGGLVLLASATWFTMAKKRKAKLAGNGGDDANVFEKQELDGQGLTLKHFELLEMDGKSSPTEVQAGRLDHELPGGYETHGVSELEGSPVEQSRKGEK